MVQYDMVASSEAKYECDPTLTLPCNIDNFAGVFEFGKERVPFK
jgi:hypothetical protein